MEVKRTERGWAGHHICAHDCRFRRNTLLEYNDKKIVVSTVGCYINKIESQIDTIGYNRWYETMAFVGHEEGGYIEADVSQEIEINQDWGLWAKTKEELFKKYPFPDSVANDIHERIVDEMIERIVKM